MCDRFLCSTRVSRGRCLLFPAWTRFLQSGANDGSALGAHEPASSGSGNCYEILPFEVNAGFPESHAAGEPVCRCASLRLSDADCVVHQAISDFTISEISSAIQYRPPVRPAPSVSARAALVAYLDAHHRTTRIGSAVAGITTAAATPGAHFQASQPSIEQAKHPRPSSSATSAPRGSISLRAIDGTTERESE
jgi:hypothetical protein